MKCTNIGCGEEFSLPMYKCPKCGEPHRDLRPGKYGLLYLKCKCGHNIPCSTVSGRTKLEAFCPFCEEKLSDSNASQFFIQLVGGTSAGKTTYLAAFQHLYINAVKNSDIVRSINVHPQHKFNELEEMFIYGLKSDATSEPNPYSFIHTFPNKFNYQFDIFDIPGEMIIDGSYKATFRVFHGLIIIIDPVSVNKVREQSENEGEDVSHYSTFNLQRVVEKFVLDFKTTRNIKASHKSNIPVAIVITKTDLKNVKREIGGPKIRAEFNKNKSMFDDDENVARDKICRTYLESLGFGNAINIINSTFNNVKYFPVSAIGPAIRETTAYEPFGVLEPIVWIGEMSHSVISKLLHSV